MAENASIASEILVDMLQTIETMDLIPRNDTSAKPFILLDGQGSRLEMPFLKINTPEDNWIACIGMPYGTAP